MTLPSTATVRSVTVPGARLHYEVRGAGPLLLVIGSPMGAADFAPLADALSTEHTVVTYDPRGIAGSTIDDLEQDSTPELRADDVAAILDDLGAEKTSEWVEETMNLIVNTRYNERRLTLFTSNYADIPDDTDPNALLFRIGHRMRSRLHEMCEFVVMDGADYREMPTNGGVDDLLAMWKMRKKTLPAPGRGGRQAHMALSSISTSSGGAFSSEGAPGSARRPSSSRPR